MPIFYQKREEKKGEEEEERERERKNERERKVKALKDNLSLEKGKGG